MKKGILIALIACVLVGACIVAFVMLNNGSNEPPANTPAGDEILGNQDPDSGTVDPCANGHTEVIDAGKDATCIETGLTEGKHCSI